MFELNEQKPKNRRESDNKQVRFLGESEVGKSPRRTRQSRG